MRRFKLYSKDSLLFPIGEGVRFRQYDSVMWFDVSVGIVYTFKPEELDSKYLREWVDGDPDCTICGGDGRIAHYLDCRLNEVPYKEILPCPSCCAPNVYTDVPNELTSDTVYDADITTTDMFDRTMRYDAKGKWGNSKKMHRQDSLAIDSPTGVLESAVQSQEGRCMICNDQPALYCGSHCTAGRIVQVEGGRGCDR